jgi:hypothetical protein
MKILALLGATVAIITVIFGFTMYYPIFVRFNSTFNERYNFTSPQAEEASNLNQGFTSTGLRTILYGFVLVIIFWGLSEMQSREKITGAYSYR